MNFTLADNCLLKKNIRRVEECREKQRAFEEERALLFKDTNPSLYKLIKTHSLPCLNVVSWYVVDTKRKSMYYNYIDITEVIFKALKDHYKLKEKTFGELLDKLAVDRDNTLEESLGNMVSITLWGFDSWRSTVPIRCIVSLEE